MPQPSLPLFQEGDIPINNQLSYRREDGKIFYFNWAMPVFQHDEKDMQTFRMITAQFCVNGGATQAEISRAFGVSLVSMKRSTKLMRKSGASVFFEKRKTRGPAVLLPEVIEQVQALLDEGKERGAIADLLGIKRDTLYKAVVAKRLHEPEKKSPNNLSQRT
jgi:transposase-like protein